MSRQPYIIPPQYREKLPDYTVETLERWVNEGGDLSGFYYEVLSGNCFDAAALADDDNLAVLGPILALVAHTFPSDAFGSSKKVRAWRGLHFLEGGR